MDSSLESCEQMEPQDDPMRDEAGVKLFRLEGVLMLSVVDGAVEGAPESAASCGSDISRCTRASWTLFVSHIQIGETAKGVAWTVMCLWLAGDGSRGCFALCWS